MFVNQLNWANTVSSYVYYHIGLKVNSGYEHMDFTTTSVFGAVSAFTMTGTAILSLSSGDTVSAFMRLDTTGSGSSTVDINSNSRFSGHLLA